MLASIGNLSLWIAVGLAWGAFIFQWKGSSDSKSQALPFTASIYSAVLLWTSFLTLLIAFLERDYTLVVVFENSDNSMTLFERAMAVWASRQGVMILWAAFLGTIVILVIWYLRDDKFHPLESRFVLILLFFSALIASFALFSQPGPFDTRSSSSDGLGLPLSLLSFWQQIHPPIAFLAYSAFVVPYAAALAIFSTKEKDQSVPPKVLWLMDFFMIVGWSLTGLFILAGSLWAYEENWGGFWAWDPVETASLILWLLATLYFHVKALVPSSHPLRTFTASLGWVGVAFAAFIVRGGLLEGLHEYAGSARAIVFSLLLLGTLVALLFVIIRSGEEIFPESLSEWKSARNKPALVTFWILVLASLINITGISVQAVNAIVADDTSIPFSYYSVGNGVVLLLLGMLLLLCERKATNWHNRQHLAILSGAIIVSSLVIVGWGSSTDPLGAALLVALISFVLVQLAYLGFQIYTRRSFRSFGLRFMHLAILFVILAYLAPGTQTRMATVELTLDEEVDVPKVGISVKITEIATKTGLEVWVEVWKGKNSFGLIKLAQGLNSRGPWSKSAWVADFLQDYHFHIPGQMFWFFYDGSGSIPVTVSLVPFVNAFRLTFGLFIVLTITSAFIIWKRRPMPINLRGNVSNPSMN